MSRRIYLAGKVNSGELRIDQFAKELEERKHIVLEKWWKTGRLVKPYLEHMETSQHAAVAMLNAAYNSDVCILFPRDDILGAAVELGAALASTKVRQDKQVIIVNPTEVRQSVFYAHPAVIAVEGLAQVRQMAWY